MRLLTESDRGPTRATEESADEPAILLDRVSVRYVIPQERVRTFKEYTIRMLQGRMRHLEFWALRDVNLTIQAGETFGIIGRNGAGKSTLLKVISRVLRPTHGRVVVRGRLAPMLELGAGFHAELSGRENVFLNGALLGFSRAAIEDGFNAIVDFAELWDFIDAPLRTYSTGMTARLGFAVATATQPDILILDEVLAVGDAAFQEKCVARMQEFRDNGTTILVVSHSPETLEKICERAAWFDHGVLRAVGPLLEIAEAYRRATEATRPERSD